ncbi:restriction endonuclease subunit S [Acinetobacter baumannii]|uniref:restriction endonuclease subunit S n=1 Tax=Acinetobacter baumannii TaxID=470 RepID=UPI00114DB716|nr:restriction endonuclease subunit S [Acinetobacter baumannii]MDP7924782.1 restriction endonuclease subunit S [Acinetobacter baumannii]TQF19725.1 restriction endonuclease subunit S [Acinetobacter baumannii]
MSEHWISTTLGEYILFKNGKSSPSRDIAEDIPVYGSNGIIGFSSESNAEEDSLIIGRVGSYCGSVYHSKKKCWVTDNAIIGLPKVKGESEFWYFLLTKLQLNSYRSGSGQPLVNQSTLNSIPVEIPKSPSVRQAIGKQLFSFENKIYLNNQINQTLESIAQAIFKSWFVDFDPVRAKIAAKLEGKNPELAAMCAISGTSEAEIEQMAEENLAELRATAALFPDELVESELGEVPKGWDKYSLSKMITLIGGGTPKRSEPNYWNGDIFWFSVKDVPNEGEVFVITTQEKISELGLNKSSTKLLPVGTTIITARGTVGKIALVGYEMAMNQSCYGVQGINGVRQFMTYYLIKNAVEVLKKNTHGAVFDTITQSTFDTVTSIKPSIEMMDLFESKVEKIMGHIKNNLYENNSLIALRDTLLPKLLSGELDVSGVQDEVA